MGLQDVTNETLVRCIYTADNGKNYTVKLKQYRQTEGGFALGAGADGWLPGNMKMRTISLILDGDKRRERLPISNLSNTKYAGTTFTGTLDGFTYRVTGRTSEKVRI